jgi:hypothetical protein
LEWEIAILRYRSIRHLIWPSSASWMSILTGSLSEHLGIAQPTVQEEFTAPSPREA